MKGVDRLRELAREQEERSWSSVGKVRARMMMRIADQIEREHAEDCFRMGERAAEDIEAIAWVRRHGGVEALRRMFQDADSRRVELCGALGIDLDKGWSEAMAAMLLRLMPEGMEWPRFEDGEPVAFHDKGLDVHGHTRSVEGVKFTQGGFIFISDDMGNAWWANDCGPMEDPEIDPSKRVKRPAPKVPAFDGKPLRVGETVWDKDSGDRLIVGAIEDGGHTVTCRYADLGDSAIPTHGSWSPCDLIHERPESKCRDCAHWQKDPTADNMGVCWYLYHECEGEDCYAARRCDVGACEEFMPRGKALAGDA